MLRMVLFHLNCKWSYLALCWSGNPKKEIVKTVKEPKKQILCHEIELNWAMHEGDNPSFWDEFIKFTFIHIRIFKQVQSTEVLSYWAVETLGDLQSTSRGLSCRTVALWLDILVSDHNATDPVMQKIGIYCADFFVHFGDISTLSILFKQISFVT
jgi:hypothetical protein